ncbi:hypothetical protein G6F57_020534 [Rhizopus arrhizus]|nr:hypothetical protein G6F57_020534 [Rhizopus arrhizus]
MWPSATTLANTAVCALMKARNSSWLMGCTSPPSSRMLATNFSSRKARPMAAASFCWTSAGVPAATNTPNQFSSA